MLYALARLISISSDFLLINPLV